MATIAIGDIHGQLKPLCDLLERVRPNIAAEDTVVFLGDYIDRGAETRGCVDAILDFTASVPATVVCLRGNHEDWMLRTMHDYTDHSWLLGMEAYQTIASYSMTAAQAIRAAARDASGAVHAGAYALPYELFFAALPAAHREFFAALARYHETPECLCSHAGLDPAAPGLAAQDDALVWGAHGFPQAYGGDRVVIYGHMNNAHLDHDDWPHPRVIGHTYGLDTIAHGVLTAIRLPGPYVLQSARYERRHAPRPGGTPRSSVMTRTLAGLPLLVSLLVAGCGGPAGPPTPPAPAADFNVVEASIPDLQAALQSGRLTSRQLVEKYLERIATYEDRLNAIITVNPRALAEADAMDKERAAGTIRGPLHGIPIALKDNIQTTDIRTTGGALAFRDLVPPYDATLTKNLRDGGAIIIAKTVLTELAHWTAGAPTPMVANYTGVAGFAYNPYDPRMDPRPDSFDGRPVLQTGGSSSGAGTAASFWAASVGSDTGGSIISPSNNNMLAGIRPTIGRISRYGVIPITADHDTAGPMGRTVTDAAVLMGVLESAAPDPNDAATRACTPPPNRDYTPFLKADALKGVRIGVPRAFFYDPITAPGEKDPRGGLNPDQAKVMAEAIALLKAQGAEVVDPADVPSIVTKDATANFLLFDYCQGAEHKRGGDANCTVNFKYGMKRDFNAWLKSLGDKAPVKSLTELRQWNVAHAKAGAMRFGQSRLDISDEMDVERDRARNDADVAKDARLSRTQGIDAVLAAHQLDAILTPAGSGANLASRAGYPIIAVPFGMVPNAPNPPFPAGFTANPAPYGVTFTGASCSEPKLIAIAYAFEQASKKRVPPPNLP